MMMRESRLDELFRLLDGTESPDECYAILATAWSEGRQSADAALRQQLAEAMGALGYPVPAETPCGRLVCGLCGPKERLNEELRTELAAVREERDEARKVAICFLEDVPINNEYVHVVTCNASRLKPVGNDMCSCPVGRRFKQQLADLQGKLAWMEPRLKQYEIESDDSRWKDLIVQRDTEIVDLQRQLAELQSECDGCPTVKDLRRQLAEAQARVKESHSIYDSIREQYSIILGELHQAQARVRVLEGEA